MKSLPGIAPRSPALQRIPFTPTTPSFHFWIFGSRPTIDDLDPVGCSRGWYAYKNLARFRRSFIVTSSAQQQVAAAMKKVIQKVFGNKEGERVVHDEDVTHIGGVDTTPTSTQPAAQTLGKEAQPLSQGVGQTTQQVVAPEVVQETIHPHVNYYYSPFLWL